MYWDERPYKCYKKNVNVFNEKYIDDLNDWGTIIGTVYLDKDNNVIIGNDIVNTIINYTNDDWYKQLDQRTKIDFEFKQVNIIQFKKDIDVEKFKKSLARISE